MDEVGQAVRQAMVDAMMRTKRSVVDDPVRIAPVTSLPTGLIVAVGTDFEVDPGRWNAPQASVQAFADAAATFVAEFLQTSGRFGSASRRSATDAAPSRCSACRAPSPTRT